MSIAGGGRGEGAVQPTLTARGTRAPPPKRWPPALDQHWTVGVERVPEPAAAHWGLGHDLCGGGTPRGAGPSAGPVRPGPSRGRWHLRIPDHSIRDPRASHGPRLAVSDRPARGRGPPRPPRSRSLHLLEVPSGPRTPQAAGAVTRRPAGPLGTGQHRALASGLLTGPLGAQDNSPWLPRPLTGRQEAQASQAGRELRALGRLASSGGHQGPDSEEGAPRAGKEGGCGVRSGESGGRGRPRLGRRMASQRRERPENLLAPHQGAGRRARLSPPAPLSSPRRSPRSSGARGPAGWPPGRPGPPPGGRRRSA